MKKRSDVRRAGADMDGVEIYIKLKLDAVGGMKTAKCISFHKADFKLCFPLR